MVDLCTRYSLFPLFFFFNDTATTEIYTLSLHDALPIFAGADEDPVEDEDVARHSLAEADDDQGRPERLLDCRVGSEERREDRVQGRDDEPEGEPSPDTPAHHRPHGEPDARAVAAAERPPRDCLGGDREGVEREGEERPDGHGHLVG